MEESLAHFRTLLEHEHRSEEEGVYKYVTPDGDNIVLVPALMYEWARAMVRYKYIVIYSDLILYPQYDGQATARVPPKTAPFRFEMKRTNLHPDRQVSATAALQSSDIGKLTSQIISSVFDNVRPLMSGTPQLPTTPKRAIRQSKV